MKKICSHIYKHRELLLLLTEDICIQNREKLHHSLNAKNFLSTIGGGFPINEIIQQLFFLALLLIKQYLLSNLKTRLLLIVPSINNYENVFQLMPLNILLKYCNLSQLGKWRHRNAIDFDMIREQRTKDLAIKNLYLPLPKQCFHFILKTQLKCFPIKCKIFKWDFSK